jgi:hypothetical protein
MADSQNKSDATGDVVLIVMEFGSRWPACFHSLLRNAPHGVVLAQDVTESPAELAARLRRRLMQLTASEHRVCAAVLSAGHSLAQDVFVNRCLMVQALARTLTPNNGRLVISGHAHLPDAARQEIARVAATMAEHLVGGPPLTLELEPPRSAVRRAVPRPSSPTALPAVSSIARARA